MKRLIGLLALSILSLADDSLVTLKGELKSVYQYNSNTNYINGSGESHTDVVGGHIGFETKDFSGLSATVLGYGAFMPIGDKKQADGDYLNRGKGNSNYALIGQAFVNYKHNGDELKVGRFELITPLLHSDNYRMTPDLVQGAYASIKFPYDYKVELVHVTNMAGWDNGGDNSQFTNIKDISMISIQYGEKDPKFGYRLYDYYTQDTINQIYGDIRYNVKNITMFAQAAKENSIGGSPLVDAKVIGAMVSVSNDEGDKSVRIAYNKSFANADAMYHGGTSTTYLGSNTAWYTSSDKNFIDRSGGAQAYKLGGTIRPTDKVSASIDYVYYDKIMGDSDSEIIDINIAYNYSKSITITSTLSNVRVDNSATNNRARLVAKYSF